MRDARRTSGIFTRLAPLVLALAGLGRAQDAVEVTASALNVRTGPDTGRAVIGQAARGQAYAALERRSGWVRLQFGADSGWASDAYLSASSDRVFAVTADALNVRTGPASRYRDVGTLTRGERVVVREAQGDWRRIDYAGRTAWVHGAYLAATSGAPAPTPARPAPAPTPTTNRPRSRAGFIQLAAAGDGFACYSVPDRRWGTPRFIYGIERVAHRWAQERRSPARLLIGDISLTNGGPISGHASHQKGVDGDFRPLRSDRVEAPITRFDAAYSRTLTQRMIDLFVAELPVTMIFFNDTQTRHTQPWPNHDNHFHVRISQ